MIKENKTKVMTSVSVILLSAIQPINNLFADSCDLELFWNVDDNDPLSSVEFVSVWNESEIDSFLEISFVSLRIEGILFIITFVAFEL